MGILGVVLGTLAGQFAGAWMFLKVRREAQGSLRSEVAAAVTAGVTTAIVSAPIYVVLGVSSWISGGDGRWGISAFLAICVGICQAVLSRSRPLRKRVLGRPVPRQGLGSLGSTTPAKGVDSLPQ